MEAKPIPNALNIANGKKRPYQANQVPQLREKAPTTPYRLREESKLPSRYREAELEVPSPRAARALPKGKSPKKLSQINNASAASGHSARRALIKKEDEHRESTQINIINSSGATMTAQAQMGEYDDFLEHSATPTYSVVQPSGLIQYQQAVAMLPHSSSNSNLSAGNISEHELSQISFDDDSNLFPGSSQGTGSQGMRKPVMSKMDREREIIEEKVGMPRLKHLLSLQKARRWAICEFFYSTIDHQLFHADNEFIGILADSFPNLKTTMLNKQQWRTIRRLLGKPRRCSEAFFREEREVLAMKRDKVRRIYEGSFFTQRDGDFSDLPSKLPRPLAVGMRVHARIHAPKDGVYGGTIDAVLKDSYRVIFDMEDMIPPLVVPDSQVMLDGKLELLPLSYFAEQATAKMPPHAQRILSNTPAATPPTERFNVVSHPRPAPLKKPGHILAHTTDEKVGNFPVRQLVVLVKLAKLLELKKKYVRQLSELNAEAERANLLTDVYHPSFQEKYAQVVVDLETLNKQMAMYLQGVQEYSIQLGQQINDGSSIRPEVLRRNCTAQANQIVKEQNSQLNLSNGRAHQLITSLISLLLQIRTLGDTKITPLDLQMLGESINEIREAVSPRNAAHFQDNVEVHMKQIHNLMLQVNSMNLR